MRRLCECGCGKPTAMARCTNAPEGRFKGQPVRFIHGHNLPRDMHRGSVPRAPQPRISGPELLCDEWPVSFGDWLVEPAAGTVKLRKPPGEPRVLDVADVKLLARGAVPDLQAVLEQAVCEAERQREALGECMA